MSDELNSLLALAQSEKWAERRRAVTQLGQRAEPEAQAAVARALYDSDDTAVTEAAVESLIRRGGDADRKALLEALRSDNDEAGEHIYGFLDNRAARGAAFAQSVLDEYSQHG